MIGTEYGLLDEGALLFERAVKLDPLTANNLLFLGACKTIQSGPQYGLKDVEKAVQLEPEFINALDFLARIYADLGRMEDAKKYFEKSMTLKPSIKDHSAIDVAYVYLKLGNTRKAYELENNDWFILTHLGLYDRAIKAMPFYDEKKPSANNVYLLLKYFVVTKEFAPLKTNKEFQRVYERNKSKYEENKKKYGILNLLNQLPSSSL